MMNDQALQKIEPEGALPAIVNEPVEAPLTAQQARIEEVNEALMSAYQKASELKLTDAENQALQAPFDDEMIEIRPHDGLLYIPHIHVSDRLVRVLGAGQWAMVRRREWVESNRIYAEYVMKIRGCFVGESVGAMDYHPNNARMNYSDALEGTRGECIRRIAAKDLGCGSQVWNPAFCRQWIAKYAEQVRGKWERKNVPQNPTARKELSKPQPTTPKNQQASGDVPHSTPATPKPAGAASPSATPAIATEEQRLRWIAELKRRGEYAEGYCRDKGWLMPESGPPDDLTPAEPIEALEARHVPVMASQAKAILNELDSLLPDGFVFPPARSPVFAPQPPAAASQPELVEEIVGDEPEPAPDDGVETMVGVLEAITEKHGKSKKGPWTLFGFKVSSNWFNSFNVTLANSAIDFKGHTVKVFFKRNDRGCDLLGIERARQSP